MTEFSDTSIVFIHRNFTGGIGTAAWYQAQMFACNGYNTYFLCEDSYQSDVPSQTNVQFVNFTKKRTPRNLMWSLLLRVQSWAAFLNMSPTDILDDQYAASIKDRLDKVTRKGEKYFIFFSDGFLEAIYWHTKRLCRTCAVFHGPRYLAHSLGAATAPVNNLLRKLDVQSIKRLDTWCAPSLAMRQFAAEYYDIPLERIRVIPNSIDTRIFSPRTPIRDAARILFVGRFTVDKGADVICDIVPQLLQSFPELTMTLVGTSEKVSDSRLLIDVLRERVGAFAGIHAIDWRDHVAHKELPEIYRSCSIFLFPTKFDNFPMACLEALASGLPVISSSVGGLPEIVKDGESGYLLPPGDRKGVLDAVERLVTNPEQRLRMSMAARRDAVKLWSFNSVFPQLERLIGDS